MQKPDFIQISLPITGDISDTAIRMYFDELVGKILEFKFSVIRNRKIFKYKVIRFKLNTWNNILTSKKSVNYVLQLSKK